MAHKIKHIFVAEKRRIYQQTYRARQKEKQRRVANGEGNSENTTCMTHGPTLNRTLRDITNATPTSVLDVQGFVGGSDNARTQDNFISQSSMPTGCYRLFPLYLYITLLF